MCVVRVWRQAVTIRGNGRHFQAGADPKFVPSFGKSALDIARTNNRAGILRLFGDE